MSALTVLSLLGNLVAGAAAFWLWSAGRRSLADRLYVMPNRIRRRTFFDRYPVEHGDIVWLGDSLTAGANWHEMFPMRAVKNRGIGGDTTAGVLDRLDQVTRGHPEGIFLLVGTNDLSLGIPHDRIVQNYAAILDRIAAETPETRVVVQSVLPRGRAYVTRIRLLNAALADLAAARGFHFVDLTRTFGRPDGTIESRYSNDELHLLGDGYVAWQQALTDLLPPVGDGRGRR